LTLVYVRSLITVFIFLLGAGAALLPASAAAQNEEPSDAEAVEAGQRALGGRTYFPFYDAQKDDVRRIEVPAEKNPERAKKDWEQKTMTATPARAFGRTSSGLAGIFQVLGLSLLALIIVGLAVLLIRAFLQGEQVQTQGTKVIDTSSDVDRVEDLPFQMKRPTGDFLSEARRLYEAGQYSEAIIYLFSYQLVALDKKHVIHLAKGKTNRQYLRETRSREPLKQVLQRTMISFEDVFFGHHELSRERFEESWRALDDFHRHLEQVEFAAA
jgi:hypothetical protein